MALVKQNKRDDWGSLENALQLRAIPIRQLPFALTLDVDSRFLFLLDPR